MSDILKRINIDDVRVGMYLGNVYNEKGVLLLSANTPVTSDNQIDAIRNQGAVSVVINLQLGRDVLYTGSDVELKKESPIQFRDLSDREEAYYEEVEKAKTIHNEALVQIKKLFQLSRTGSVLEIGPVVDVTEGIIQSIFRNPDALVSLTQIKGFEDYVCLHSVNVAMLMATLAHALDYNAAKVQDAAISGLLMDIGKMRLPEHILNKPGKYTEIEFSIMKKHPEHSVQMLKEYRNIPPMARVVALQHHERMNGRGYPNGLIGKQIQEPALIAAVADVYDAMTTDKSYRQAWTPQTALATIFQGADADYSRRIVELFTRNLGIYPVGSFVKLMGGEMAVVTRIERGKLLAPDVLVLIDKFGRKFDTPYELVLSEKQKEADGENFRIAFSLNPISFGVDISAYIQGRGLTVSN